MEIFDITRPLHPGIATYPGDPPFIHSLHSDIAHGDPCTVSYLSFGAHSGTHLDAPAHFLPQGKPLGEISLTALIGPCRVIVKKSPGHVTVGDVGEIRAGERILVRTANSELDLACDFQEDYSAFTPEAARYLVDCRAALVGIDYLSIEPYGSKDASVHKILLAAGVVILEGLILKDISPGEYLLVALPMAIPEAEGAPVRAILIKDWHE